MIRPFLAVGALAALPTVIHAQCGGKDRFGLDSAHVRLIDNDGEGYQDLPALRNLRVILKDVAYRGGVENLKSEVGVQHPLSPKAIEGLKEQGFDKAEYLYSRRFKDEYPQRRLDSLERKGFDYVCTPELEDVDVERILREVKERAESTRPRPVYYHCWNGRHQSGMLAAMMLMQFCGLNNAQGMAYWYQCTNSDSLGYDKVKQKVMGFKPFPGLTLTPAARARVCPCFSERVLSARELPSPRPVVHVVKSGDTLGAIAKRNGITLEALMKANKLGPKSILKPGQRLTIPTRP